MEFYIMLLILALLIITVILQIVILFGKSRNRSVDELKRKLGEMSSLQSNEFQRSRQESSVQLEMFSKRLREEFHINRQENSAAIKEINDKILRIQDINSMQSDKLNNTLIQAVSRLQESNEKKLDQMRQTVDEKLTDTLTKRLDSSFRLVGEQLKDVHKSLGEMRELAEDVSDLQRVLTNVKIRGTWAEVQLGSILEQTLTSEQYEQNVSPKNNGEIVEYAIKIPSRDDSGGYVWLPIDSKFPQEDYIRLCDAAEKADKTEVENAVKSLERRIKNEAAKISKLYINVPVTTDFAILFLPTEGLYAEILRIPGLAEELQTKYRVMVCGPTTITAFLNTLRMGFRTIALDKRASEVWKVLGAAKTQYDKFEVILAKVKKKIDEAGNTLESAQSRNRIILKNLKNVEELKVDEADDLLGISGGI
jgi:DNA recombination protein RmuC